MKNLLRFFVLLGVVLARVSVVYASPVYIPLGDVDDCYTVSLLHFNGTNGSTTFTDESGKSWAASGNAALSTSTLKFGSANLSLDNSGDIISTADHVDWYLGDGSDANSWTIDFWWRFSGDPGTGLVRFIGQEVDADNRWYLGLDNNLLVIRVRSGAVNTVDVSFAYNPAGNQYIHFEFVKDGANGYMAFANGTQVGSTVVDTDPIPNLATDLFIHALSTGTGAFIGRVDELRISKGIARHTSNFTAPTAEYGSGGCGSPTDTPTATATFTATATYTPSMTFTPSATATDTPTPTDTPIFTDTPTFTPSATFTPSNTPTITATSQFEFTDTDIVYNGDGGFWFKIFSGVMFIMTKMYWEGVLFFVILPYLLSYFGENSIVYIIILFVVFLTRHFIFDTQKALR